MDHNKRVANKNATTTYLKLREHVRMLLEVSGLRFQPLH